MTQARLRFSTIEEYLAYDDGTDTPYELVNGVLVKMGAESDLNTRIAFFLLVTFSRFVPLDQLRNKTEIETPSTIASSRYPDFVVLSEEGAIALANAPRSLLRLEMPTPMLNGEVVSPGEPGGENYNRDYIDKRKEYAERGIPEYWIVDPVQNVVIVLYLDGEQYREIGRFENDDRLISPTFPQLQLIASQVLKAGQ
jgi:Uma2 family endonuclease